MTTRRITSGGRLSREDVLYVVFQASDSEMSEVMNGESSLEPDMPDMAESETEDVDEARKVCCQ